MDGLDGGRIWTKSFLAVCLSSFFVLLNFYTLATALPLYVKEILHGSQQQMGLVITFWSIGVVLLRLFSGTWTDRFGKKRLTMLSLAVFLAASVLYFGASSIALLLLLRVIHGGSYGVANTSTSALAADMIPESRKGEGIGYFSMFISVAMVVGPAFGITVWNHYHDSTVLFAVSSAMSVLALAVAWLAGPEPQHSAVPRRKEKGPLLRNLFEAKALPISIAGFILAFSYSSLTTYITSYTKELHQEQAAGLFFIVFAVMIVMSRPLVGKVFDKYGGHFLVYPGVACFAAGMLMLSRESASSLLLLSGAVLGLGHGALFPSFQTLAIQAVSKERRGMATSTFFLLFDLGYGVGSFVLGLIAEAAGYRTMYLSACLIALAVVTIYYFLHHRRTASNAEQS